MDLHPFFTHFPIALLILVFFLECFAFWKPYSGEARKIIELILWIAVIATVASFFTGFEASEAANKTFKVDDAAIATHYTWARLLLFSVPTTVVFHLAYTRARESQGAFRAVYLLFLCVSVTLALIAGYHGGELVFRHGAGVEAPLVAEK